MSDLRIGLVVEGKTDEIIIVAALKSILTTPFVPIRIQPEDIGCFGGFGETGSGWGGVYRWCRQYVSQSRPSLSELFDVDMLIIHIDADVAGKHYSDANLDNPPIQDLPCELPCPPAMDTVEVLRSVMAGWLDYPDGSSFTGNRVFCIPSKNTEAWIVAALYGQQPQSLECNPNWEGWLSQRPIKEGRFKKSVTEYRKIEKRITAQWDQIARLCTTAFRFSADVKQTIYRS